MNSEQLRAATFVRHVEIHDELDSTSTRAAELAREISIELPALVVARRQMAGRGRSGKSWWSAEGALTFSLLIEPAAMRIGTSDWPRLSLTTAVAVCDGLRPEVPQSKLGIKWPNDVYLDNRKVGGILIESPGGAAPAKDRLVIGIGINVNNSLRSAPLDVNANGTSLCDVIDRRLDLQELLVRLLHAFVARSNHLSTLNTELISTWRQLDVLAGRNILLEADGQTIDGNCVEIAHDGALVVDNSSGRRRFYSGSVRMA